VTLLFWFCTKAQRTDPPPIPIAIPNDEIKNGIPQLQPR
jgi:hypothetical protein